jgi:hypothetical protein
MSDATRELQKAIATGSCSLTKLLRQTKVIAAKLGLEDVESWVICEVEGYAEKVELPAYRKVFTDKLEVYNERQDSWHFAGHLNLAFPVHQPIEKVEDLSRRDFANLPVARKFSIKNDFGDSFGTDWPQRFSVKGAQYQAVLEAVAERWTDELEKRGIAVSNFQRLFIALNSLSVTD